MDLVFNFDSCDCPTLVVRGAYNHYDKKKDRLGTTWDDFGYIIYEDDKNEKHKLYGHSHLGVIYSYHHPCCEDPKDGWKIKEFIKDNSVIPEIKKYFLKHNLVK